MSRRIDVRQQPAVLRQGIAPRDIPPGRWVADADRPLALSQQFAVSATMRTLLGSGGLFAVNGPPGTGKTTMLRDLVAAVVVERAMRIAELASPADAFAKTRVHTWRMRRMKHTIRSPLASLTGFEMLAASANNAAVENITMEMPGPGAIGRQWRDAAADLDYFTETARLASGNGAWALVAARLGNSQNRGEFVNAFWWGRGDEAPAAAAGEPNHGMRSILKQLETADIDWPSAVRAFRMTLDKVRRLAAARQAAATAIEDIPRRGRDCDAARDALARRQETLAGVQDSVSAASRKLATAELRWQAAHDSCEAHDQLKPGLLVSISTGFRAGRDWYATLRELRADLADAQRLLDAAQARAAELRDRAARASDAVRDARRRLAGLTRAQEQRRAVVLEAQECWDGHVPAGPEFAETHDPDLIEARERSAPWADPEFTRARTELFIAALRLHKQFIAGAARAIRGNLGALMDMLMGSSRPDGAAALAAWQTFFLVVPIASSTFASADRLLAGLGRESLGWLLIDEAGQACPQHAAGAIWRARRTVVVGDPQQLEPVITLPTGVQDVLLREFEVSAEWQPSAVSVQAVADRLARFGTLLPGGREKPPIWVGAPLRVHRRCDRPMFAICNAIAYDGLMVFGTAERGEFHGRSIWYDVPSSIAEGHWKPAEGEALRRVLTGLRQAGVPPAEIRVISPFRQVVARAKAEYRQVFSEGEAPPEKVSGWIGTVHTMQGKEADVVILVLGSDPRRDRARGWAVKEPNLLNVAVSRARRRLYVIGDHDQWKSLPNIRILASNLDRWS